MNRSDVPGILGQPLAYLDAADAPVRRLAVSVLAGRTTEPGVRQALVGLLSADPDGAVRAEAAEVLAAAGAEAEPFLVAALDDDDARVVEAAITALGEIRSRGPLPRLVEAALYHEDRLVREAAVAALGAIGDPRAVPVLLELVTKGPPQVRRRAVAALTVFDDPAIEPSLRRATQDRNPMVREVAEMVVGRRPPEGWEPIQLTAEDPRP